MKHELRLAVVLLWAAVAGSTANAQNVALFDGAHPGASTPSRGAFAATVTGTVTDQRTGQPLQNAQVSVVGTAIGAATDIAGKYRIPGVPAGNIQLRVRFIGYSPIDRSVNVADGQTVVVDFAMEVKALSLDAMVVTGTAGGTKAREIGNAVSLLNAGSEKETPSVNIQQLLGQRAAGVVVAPAAGMVGAGSAIRIRGTASMSLTNQPIIYVDGVRIDNSVASGPSIRQGRTSSRLNDFNPEDIESIEIIKGPAAATLYGTEASNGVIQILTKRGKTGTAKLDLTMREGANFMQNAESRFRNTYGLNPLTQKVDSFNVFNLYRKQYPGKELFTTGPLRSLNLSLSGGTDAAKYFVSADNSKSQGILDYNWQNLTSARANLALLPGKNWQYDTYLNYNQSETRYAQAADGFGIWDMMVWSSPTLLSSTTKGWRYALPSTAAQVDSRAKVNRFTGGMNLKHSPTTWFTQALKLGADVSYSSNQILFPKVPDGEVNFFGARVTGEKTLEGVSVSYNTLDYSATAKKDFGALTTATSAGAQYYRRQTTSQTAVGSSFPTTDITTIGGAASTVAGETFVENKTLGFYLQETVGWRNRVFVTSAIRGDANSAFGKDYAAAYYPKLSGAWVISEEPFFGRSKWTDKVSTLRLRGSWGQAGQQPDAFAALRLYTPTTGPGATSTVTPSSVGNTKLRPERGTELDFGFDLTLLDDRLTFEYTHYNKWTTDAIVNVPVWPSTGFPGNVIQNIGKTKNWGTEMSANMRLMTRQNFGWDLGLTYATANNLITDLGGKDLQAYRVGYPVSAIYIYRVTNAAFDAAGKLVNVMCDGGPGKAPTTCDVAPQVFWGQSIPKWTGNFSNSFTLWEKLRLTALIDYQGSYNSVDGDIAFAHTNFQNTSKIWTSPPDPYFAAYQTVVPRAALGFYDAGFAKLRELSVNYTLPVAMAHRIGASSAAVTGAWRNVAILWRAQKDAYGVKIFDPETRAPGESGATYQTTIPPASQAVITIRLGY